MNVLKLLRTPWQAHSNTLARTLWQTHSNTLATTYKRAKIV